MTDEVVGARAACPGCGATDLDRVDVAEHETCGAMKFAGEFQAGGEFVCPDCHRVCGDELRLVETDALYRCGDCGRRFDAVDAVPTTEPDGTGRIYPRWTGATNRLAFVSKIPASTRTILTFGFLGLVLAGAVVTALGTAPFLAQRADSEPDGSERADAGEWNSYRSIVIFRNDDVQPYYRMEEMRAVDEVFVEAGVPVTAGVIPATGEKTIDGQLAVCEYWRGRLAEHPELFEYALHGFHHRPRTEFHGGSEFGNVPPETQRSLIERGTRAVRNCLDTRPETFIPPRETYDENTSTALADAGYAGVSGGEWFTKAYFNESGHFVRDGIVHAPSEGGFISNWSNGAFYSERTLEDRFDRVYANDSLYVQMIHYQYFTNESRLGTLEGLIRHMKSKDGVRFMTLGEFSRKVASEELERTDDGWRVREITASGSANRSVDARSRVVGRASGGSSVGEGRA